MSKRIQEARYVTRYGDTVDYIAWKHYGSERGGTTEMIMEANIGLCANGPVLMEGLIVVLPELTIPTLADKLIELWD